MKKIMNLHHLFKALLFSVFLLFSQQGLANDSYDLEEFRKHYKKNSEPPSGKRQNGTDDSITSPFNHIRIGFFGLNLAADDISGDDRLEIHGNFVLDEQNFEHLSDFCSYYVDTGDPQYRQARIQKILRLIFHIFTVNMTTEHSWEDQEQIKLMAENLYHQLFSSTTTANGEVNPYYLILNTGSEKTRSEQNHIINHGLVLMLYSFLAPYALPLDIFSHRFAEMISYVTRFSYQQALSNLLISGNISNYDSPQGFANQLQTANLDTETALLIGLSSMSSASQQHIDFGTSWPETLEEVLQRFFPNDVLPASYENMSRLCRRPFRSTPDAIYNPEGMQEFVNHITGIDLRPPEPVEEDDSCSEASGHQSCHSPRDSEPPQNSGSPQNSYFPEDFDSDRHSDSDSESSGNETAQEAGAAGGTIGQELGMYFLLKDQ